jgi:predicted protein tyrosine phosphatase
MSYTDFYKSNADLVLPGIWLGNKVAAHDEEFLRRNKIQAVFNGSKDIPFHSYPKRHYRIPVHDNLEEEEIRNMELWSYEIVYKLRKEVKRAEEEGTQILVHCAAGMQRSAAIIAMYLIALERMKTEDAIEYIQEKRPIAFRPSANFEKAIRGFESSLQERLRGTL